MQTTIHPTAIIDESAVIGSGVSIGPYTVVGPGVEIGGGCEIASHVVLTGPTRLGSNNRIYQFSSVGQDTPDLKYKGEDTTLVIGDNNVIREGVTIHRGTVQDRGETTIGDDNLLMAYVHVGHDCVIGDNTILVNSVALAGHVVIRDWAILSGFSMVHQYCSIGEHAFTGMGAAIGKDVPAYVMVAGTRRRPKPSTPRACAAAVLPASRSLWSTRPTRLSTAAASPGRKRWRHWPNCASSRRSSNPG